MHAASFSRACATICILRRKYCATFRNRRERRKTEQSRGIPSRQESPIQQVLVRRGAKLTKQTNKVTLPVVEERSESNICTLGGRRLCARNRESFGEERCSNTRLLDRDEGARVIPARTMLYNQTRALSPVTFHSDIVRLRIVNPFYPHIRRLTQPAAWNEELVYKIVKKKKKKKARNERRT